jgi:ribosomal protein L17
MRSVGLLASVFFLVALIWTIQVPFSAYSLVQSFGDPNCDPASVEETLRQASAASPALKYGLNSHLPAVRLRCARLLAMRDDPAGEEHLLEALRSDDPRAEDAAAVAEVYLVSIWDRRDGPPENERYRLARAEGANDDAALLKVLKDLLARYPRWIGGYVRRAQLFQRNGEAMDARRDALVALLKEPNEFEAMVVLAQIDLSINAAQDAYLCMEQAVRINPRLRHDQRDEIREIIRAMNADRERVRRERRRDTPVI